MSIGSILLALALLIISGLFLAQPFLVARRRDERPLSRKQRLLAQKEAVLEEIRALDFDHETNKIPDDVYQAQREQLVAVATAVLQEIDALGREAPPDDVAAQIEAALNRVRAQKQGAAIGSGLPGKTAVSANGRTQFCPQCGAKIDGDDKFCAACGHKLAIPA